MPAPNEPQHQNPSGPYNYGPPPPYDGSGDGHTYVVERYEPVVVVSNAHPYRENGYEHRHDTRNAFLIFIVSLCLCPGCLGLNGYYWNSPRSDARFIARLSVVLWILILIVVIWLAVTRPGS